MRPRICSRCRPAFKQFAATCSGGDKLAANKTADELFGFARRCLQDSALPSQDTDELRTKINYIELSRDDKAHRFVVTWNAFRTATASPIWRSPSPSPSTA